MHDDAFTAEAREAALFANRLYLEGLLTKEDILDSFDVQANVFAGKSRAINGTPQKTENRWMERIHVTGSSARSTPLQPIPTPVSEADGKPS